MQNKEQPSVEDLKSALEKVSVFFEPFRAGLEALNKLQGMDWEAKGKQKELKQLRKDVDDAKEDKKKALEEVNAARERAKNIVTEAEAKAKQYVAQEEQYIADEKAKLAKEKENHETAIKDRKADLKNLDDTIDIARKELSTLNGDIQRLKEEKTKAYAQIQKNLGENVDGSV